MAACSLDQATTKMIAPARTRVGTPATPFRRVNTTGSKPLTGSVKTAQNDLCADVTQTMGAPVYVSAKRPQGVSRTPYFSNKVVADANEIIDGYITIRDKPTSVPDAKDIQLKKNEGVLLDATYLYADMADSSTLAQRVKKPVTAKIIRGYLNAASNILRFYGGEIRSFDGDRVMAIFIGTGKETRAVRAGLAVNWLVNEALQPMVSAKWTDIATFWRLRHSIGIDTGEALLTRTGVRGDNDLISIGGAPTVAAKLSDIRDGVPLHITSSVYDRMDNSVACTETNVPLWNATMPQWIGSKLVAVLRSNASWEPE